MPLDPGNFATLADRLAELNNRYRHHGAVSVLEHALGDADVGDIALVSSFGAESVVLLHMVSVIAPALPVLFIDTEMLFPETLVYQALLAARLDLRDLRTIRADPAERLLQDPDATLHQRDPDACCALRKTRPLESALNGFDGWITGRKRFQGGTRAALEFFEAEGDLIKINPLAHWGPDDVQDYLLNNRLPRHPLVARGYPSIGCAPCTSPVAAGEDPRAGRWRGSPKTECGIHFIDGRMVRGPVTPEGPAMTETPTATPAAMIVRDDGFHPDDRNAPFAPPADGPLPAALDLGPGDDPAALTLDGVEIIRIGFPKFADGRGFTLARRLRDLGFTGRLRARGIIADQYAMARRSGFDEVEIDAALAARQPQDQWLARADWRAHDYRSRLRG
jgi:phosphoadenosine phosphosulfate reductase